MGIFKIIKLVLVLTTLIASAIIPSTCSEIIKGCTGDTKNTLIKKCKKFVTAVGPSIPPSEDCCNAVKTADIPCFCKFITPTIEKVISMKKVVSVAAACGRPFAHNDKCGSYTVPKAQN